MAVMINCATDYTYDLFVEDMEKYTATPIRGVHCRRNAGDRERFARTMKNMVRDYKEEWAAHSDKVYDKMYGWIGDGFIFFFFFSCFSDLYKDTYNQRPHLDMWFYVTALGLPTGQDVFRTFCSSPVEDAIEAARRNREHV